MAEMDLDFDGPSKASTRPSRFAPKSSKLKPQPQPVTKPKPETPSSSSDPPIPTKKEELVSKPSVKDHPAENGAAMGKDDVPLDENTTGDDMAEEEQIAMDTDSVEDEVVREIDVFFTPSSDPNSQVYLSFI